GARVQFAPPDDLKGEPEYVNAEGFRGPSIPLAREPGTLRVATLGDSTTYGVGVTFADTFSARLQELLRARGTRADVLDGGVDGFTLAQGLERYRERVRPYRPDVVVATFGSVNEHFAAQDGLSDGEKIRRSIERSGPVAT